MKICSRICSILWRFVFGLNTQREVVSPVAVWLGQRFETFCEKARGKSHGCTFSSKPQILQLLRVKFVRLSLSLRVKGSCGQKAIGHENGVLGFVLMTADAAGHPPIDQFSRSRSHPADDGTAVRGNSRTAQQITRVDVLLW